MEVCVLRTIRWLALALLLPWLLSPADIARAADPVNTALLCTPRLAQRSAARCRSPIGPAADELDRARSEQVRLPTRSIDNTLGYLFFEYLQVKDRVDLYPTAESAAKGGDAQSSQYAGFVYLASLGEVKVGGTRVYSTVRGYARAGQLSHPPVSEFHGLAFYRTPRRPFGWLAAGGICPRTGASISAPFGQRCYTRYHQVLLLSETESDGIRWLQIGDDEWVDADYVAEVYPDDPPADMLAESRWVDVNLAEQVVRAFDNGQMVYATLASTGRAGFWTRPGSFQVWTKLQADDMGGGAAGPDYYLLERVPWVLYFDQARALHGTYWHNRFGQPSSHGCVNLSAFDAHWFFNFAEVGTTIHVWDPSGQTPTDPAAYGPGGA
jgi:hypothetical protein